MMTDRAEDFYAAMWADLRRNRTDAVNTPQLRAFSQTRSRSIPAYPIQPIGLDSTNIIASAIFGKTGEMKWPEKCVLSRNASPSVPGEWVRSLSRH
jgi:hypothetical protein